MQLYGDKIVKIKGLVHEYDENFLFVHFTEYNKNAYVPKYLIKHRVKINSREVQFFYLPEWFLKRNRVIPFY